MSVGQIRSMHIIPNAGAVVSVVISTKDLNILPLAGRRIQNQGYQVGFRVMSFTDFRIGIGTGRVKIYPIYAPTYANTLVSFR